VNDPVRRFFSTSLIAAVVLCAACNRNNEPQSTTPVPGGSLGIAVLEPLDFLTPIRPIRPSSLEFMVHITPPLGRVDQQGMVQPLAARDWLERFNLWDFYISDLQWEDGHRVRPEDFQRTYEYCLHSSRRSEWNGRYDFIHSVSAINDTILRIAWNHLPPNRYRAGMFMPLPTHVLGDQPDVRDYTHWPVTRKPLSCGPFRVEESTISSLRLVRNDAFSRRPTLLDTVRVQWLKEEMAVEAFRRGEVDVIDDISAAGVQQLRKISGTHTFATVGRSYLFLGWNLADSRAKDLSVRRAATMSVDMAALIEKFTLGQAEPSRGPLLPIQGFADTTQVLPFDPDASRQLLIDAGWRDSNSNGILDRRGTNLHFQILVAEEKQLHLQVAMAIATAMQEVGIGASVLALPTMTFLNRLHGGEFEAFIGQWFPDLDADIENVWSTNNLGQMNFGGYASAKADSLMLALRYELQTGSRDALLSSLQRTIYDDQPYLFLMQVPRFVVVSERLRGADPNVLSTFWNLPEWWIPQRWQ
jgi:peptide/nickel transport system substrate-binding protein